MTSNADYERLVPDLLDSATKDCCRNDAWRGRLCPYHDGYRDGLFDLWAAGLDDCTGSADGA